MMMEATERLYLTADRKRLVREGDTEGAELYIAPGDMIPLSAVELFGLVDGTLPGKGAGKSGGGTKERPASPNKEKQPGDGSGDKSGGGTGSGDDLTKVKGIGAKTAPAFVNAGFGSYAALAAIDPAQPPAIEGLGVRTNWIALVDAARALVPPAPAADQDAGAASGDGGAGAGDMDQGAA